MKSWKSNYTAILIAETLAIAGFAVSMPVIPLFLEEDLGILDHQKLKTWSGIIQSCAAITLAIFAPIWGHLADIFSRRAMLLRSMFGGAIIVSLMTFTTSPWQLLVLRSMQGCVTGTVAAATVLTAGISPAAKVAMALGLLQTGVSIGNSLGPLIGGVISDFLGRRLAFLATGIMLAGAGLIVLKWVEDDARPFRERQSGEKKSLIPDLKPILSSPVLMALMMVTFSLQAATSMISPVLPLFIKEIAGGTTLIGSATGFVLGVSAGATALAAFLVGKYSVNFGYWKTLIFCLITGCILTIPQAFVSNIIQLTIFRAMAMFFIGGATPVVSALFAVTVDKDHQGSVYGVNSSISSTGGALGPLIGSATAAILDFRAVFFVTALILGLSSAATIIRRRKYLKDKQLT